MVEILDLNSLLAQLILAIGAAMLFGNGYAIYKERKGERPKDAPGEFRAPRAWFLMTVGLLMAVWGLASLI